MSRVIAMCRPVVTVPLQVISEAESLAKEIQESEVQHCTYLEANVLLRVLDGRDAPLAELIANPDAQEVRYNL